MHNCIILGAGRSGTSMVAGALAEAGYRMGDKLHPPRDSNPKGFFEDVEINDINEELLAPVVPVRPRPRLVGDWLYRHRPVHWQRWMAQVPLEAEIKASPALLARMKRVVEVEPFCFKDPRFSYTLPAWRPVLDDTKFVCVFRDPAVTARSILKECQRYYDLRLDYAGALEVWQLMYRHVLERHSAQGAWLFLHYDQVLEGSGLDRLARFTGASVDRSFPDPQLRRTQASSDVPLPHQALYEALCHRAEYHLESDHAHVS